VGTTVDGMMFTEVTARRTIPWGADPN